MIKRTFHLSCAFIISSCLILLLTTCGENPICASGGSVSPLLTISLQVANGIVYLGAKHLNTKVQDVYAINGHTGSANWHTSINDVDSQYSSSFSVGGQVLLLGPHPQGGLQSCIALRTSDGQQLSPAYHECSRFFLQDNMAYELVNNRTIEALNISDVPYVGKLLWQAAPLENIGTLSMDNGILYVSGSISTVDSTIASIAALRASDGALLWKYAQPVDVTIFQSPIIVHKIVFFTVGTSTGTFVYALRASDGSVLWRYWKPYIFDVVVGPDDIIYVNSGQSDQDVTTLPVMEHTSGLIHMQW